MSGYMTDSVLLAQSLAVERRWLVTGTPTKGLISVVMEPAKLEQNSIYSLDKVEVSLRQEKERKQKEVAANRDKIDLNSLKTIIKSFLKMQPWSLAPLDPLPAVSWSKVARSYRDRDDSHADGPIERSLREVFIKHQIKDIDRDIELPPLSNRIIYLKPSYSTERLPISSSLP